MNARGDDRSDLWHSFQLGEARGVQCVDRLETLGENLGVTDADVSNRQAGEQAVKRPILARLDRRDEIGGRLFPHPIQIGECLRVELVKVGEA